MEDFTDTSQKRITRANSSSTVSSFKSATSTVSSDKKSKQTKAKTKEVDEEIVVLSDDDNDCIKPFKKKRKISISSSISSSDSTPIEVKPKLVETKPKIVNKEYAEFVKKYSLKEIRINLVRCDKE